MSEEFTEEEKSANAGCCFAIFLLMAGFLAVGFFIRVNQDKRDHEFRMEELRLKHKENK